MSVTRGTIPLVGRPPSEGTWDQAASQEEASYAPLGGQTNTCENMAFPQLRWRAVKMLLQSLTKVLLKCKTWIRAGKAPLPLRLYEIRHCCIVCMENTKVITRINFTQIFQENIDKCIPSKFQCITVYLNSFITSSNSSSVSMTARSAFSDWQAVLPADQPDDVDVVSQ